MSKLSSFAARYITIPGLLLLSVLPAMTQTPLLPDSVVSSGTLRNNYTGFVGMEFSFNSVYEVGSLGRAYFAGNTGTHTLKLVNASTGLDVPNASVQITMSPSNGSAFEYQLLPLPVTLQANTNYLLLSSETAGGDTWHDLESVTPSGGYSTFLIGGAVYSDAGGVYQVASGTAGYSYVPANLLYGSPSNAIVTITSPIAGQQVGQFTNGQFTSFNFSASISSEPSLAGSMLQFKLDGQLYGPEVSAPASGTTFTLAADSTQLASGQHSVSANFFSAEGAFLQPLSPVVFNVSGGQRPFVVSQTPGALRNNFSGFVGMEFQVDRNGSANYQVEVSALGRYVWPGNQGLHDVKLFDATAGADVPGSLVTVALRGVTAGHYAYTYMAKPVVLKGSDTYYLLSQETLNGDMWGDYGPVSTSYFPANGPVYQSGSSYVAVNFGAGYSYGPVNMLIDELTNSLGPVATVQTPAANAIVSGTITVQAAVQSQSAPIETYQLQVDGQLVGVPSTSPSIPLDTTTFADGSHTLAVTTTDARYDSQTSTAVPITISNSGGVSTPSAFVTGFHPTFVRNNFSGFVGTQFTVGGTPLRVSSLGRFCVAGNSQTHTIKLTQASDGSDVPGGLMTVDMSGCTAGQYVYISLSSGVTLSAGATYNLVDLETSGGDQWYDYGPITTTSDATVAGSVYSNTAGALILFPAMSTSYVPLNFKYVALTGQGSNTLTTAISTVFFNPNYPSYLTATANGTAPVTSVQILIDGYTLTPPLMAAPYTQTLPSINLGTHNFSSVARDSAGDVATSAPFPYTLLTSSTPYDNGETPLVTFTAGRLRNDYTGWVGFQFTQGGPINLPGSPYTVPAATPPLMGRTCLAGNTQPHIVKIVRASDGVDMASTWINCAAVASGGNVPMQQSFGFVQGAGLVAGTSYYLVSQETSGGDQFTDIGPATPFIGIVGGGDFTSEASNFSIDGPVYFDGVKYVPVPMLPNMSYAGVYFLALITGI